MLGFKLAKASNPLSEGKCLKECMVETAGCCIRRTKTNKKIKKLSRVTVTHRVEMIDEDIASELQKQAESFKLYSLGLAESNNIKDTAQLLILSEGLTTALK